VSAVASHGNGTTPEPLVEARGLSVGFGSQPVVRGIDLRVGAGEVVLLLGPNGAGKTTTLLCLAGEYRPMGGEVSVLGVEPRTPLHRRARQGLAFVTEERSIFRSLSTADNLRAGDVSIEAALELFPELEKRLSVRAGLLSGGEQQMLTLARALSRKPRLLLADELSLGLGPLVVKRLLDAVARVAKESGMGVLLVEQHVRKALRYADRGYVMRQGEIVLEGSANRLHERIGEVEDSYLAGAENRLITTHVGDQRGGAETGTASPGASG